MPNGFVCRPIRPSGLPLRDRKVYVEAGGRCELTHSPHQALFQSEFRVVDQADGISPRILHRGDGYFAADVGRLRVLNRAQFGESRHRAFDVLDAPIAQHVRCLFLRRAAVLQQAELVPRHIEADIEGLVEIGFHLERPGIPCLRLGEVANLVDCGPETEDRIRHAVPPMPSG